MTAEHSAWVGLVCKRHGGPLKRTEDGEWYCPYCEGEEKWITDWTGLLGGFMAQAFIAALAGLTLGIFLNLGGFMAFALFVITLVGGAVVWISAAKIILDSGWVDVIWYLRR